MASNERWYAVKTRPGTQRQAKPRVGEAADRKGEFIIERNLRDAGFDIFMPSTYREIRHHKMEELIVNRFPLLVGSSFVIDPHSVWELSVRVGVFAILGIAAVPTRIISSDLTSNGTAEQRDMRQSARRGGTGPTTRSRVQEIDCAVCAHGGGAAPERCAQRSRAPP